MTIHADKALFRESINLAVARILMIFDAHIGKESSFDCHIDDTP
jgi:hypothetical protein